MSFETHERTREKKIESFPYYDLIIPKLNY